MLRNWTKGWGNISLLTSATERSCFCLFVCLSSITVLSCVRSIKRAKATFHSDSARARVSCSTWDENFANFGFLHFSSAPAASRLAASCHVCWKQLTRNKPSVMSLPLSCVCVWFFFTPNSGNEEESCTPLTFCPPRDDNCTRSGAGKKKKTRARL